MQLVPVANKLALENERERVGHYFISLSLSLSLSLMPTLIALLFPALSICEMRATSRHAAVCLCLTYTVHITSNKISIYIKYSFRMSIKRDITQI
jgi:hypothetical protein